MPETVAVLVMAPAAEAVTVTITVAIEPMPSEPMFAVTMPDEPTGGVTRLPWLVVAETNFIEAGRLSVTTTPVAPVTVLLFLATNV